MKMIDLIAGARPNFMKIAPIIEAINKAHEKGSDLSYRLIHTGQHYDQNMSGSFFEQLRLPEPDINLGIGSGTQAVQAAGIMVGYEKVLIQEKSNLCVVVGDVTSTMACAITAQKMHVPVAHVEGGLRSGDWSMPEEVNRIVTDAVSNWYFTTSQFANDNLLKGGVKKDRIFLVGNTMIDTLISNLGRLKTPEIWRKANLQEKKYLLLTLHRPNNVDSSETLKHFLETIIKYRHDLPVVFPVHPRTKKILQTLKEDLDLPDLYKIEPLSYLEFNYLVKNAMAVITDSGGITEETTVLGVPCMTLRDSTERPETISLGTNELVGTKPEALQPYLARLFAGKWKNGRIPPFWDGKAAERIVRQIEALL